MQSNNESNNKKNESSRQRKDQIHRDGRDYSDSAHDEKDTRNDSEATSVDVRDSDPNDSSRQTGLSASVSVQSSEEDDEVMFHWSGSTRTQVV